MPNIDHIIVHENLIKQHRITRYGVDWTPCYRIFDHDEDNIETDPTPPTVVSKTYEEVILEADPIHYWRLDESSTGSPADDIGSGNNDGTYSAGVSLSQSGAIVGDADAGTAAQFIGNTDYIDISDHDIGTIGAFYKNMTIEFWVKVPSLPYNSSQCIIGKRATGTTSEDKKVEFQVSVGSYNHVAENGGVASESYYLEFYAYNPYVIRPTQLSDGGAHRSYRCYVDLGQQVNKWVHICCVIDNGHRRLYVNGKLAQFSRLSYQVKKKTATFREGFIGSDYAHWWETSTLFDRNGAPIAVYMDEIAMYDKALSDSEIARHYNIGQDLYNETTSAGEGGGTGGGGPGETDPCDPFLIPTLTVGKDVSNYVLDYTIDYDATQLVESCVLTVTEEWPFENLKEQLRSNTYMVIEERYRTIDEQFDSDWFSIGHFLVDGPYAKDITAEGQKVYKVTCRGLLKLSTFDLANWHVTPDTILVPRTELDLVTTTLETFEYQEPRPGITGEYYENWTEVPNIKLWVSDFRTSGDIVNASTPPIRVRGAENSIQVVGGAGKVVFDKDYFQSKVQDNGLGNPETVEAEFYRYASNLDVAMVDLYGSITSLSGTDIIDAMFEVTDPRGTLDINQDYVGRTLIIKSGGASGRMFRITEIEAGGVGYYIHVLDHYGFMPDLSILDLAEGDQLQLSDANLIEDALAKVLIRSGFQNEDSDKPFYFELEPAPFPVLVPAIRYNVEDNVRWSEVLNEILEFGPPNYHLYVDENGVVRTKVVVQKPVVEGRYDHEVIKIFDMSQDRDDFGIYTRVVALGRSPNSTNVGLHMDVGGYSDVGAYKLTNFYDGNAGSAGVTKTQSQADAIMAQIPNGNPKQPNLSGSSTTNYGILYNIGNSSAQRWTMEDTDFMWMDIGKAADGNQHLIDYLQFTVLPPYQDGSVLKQTMYVYYMTEDDYIKETGTVPPDSPGDATVATNLTALKNSSLWKLLIDEFPCEDGQTNVESSEFLYGKPCRLRFLKFRAGQPYFRFKTGSGNNISRIVLSDVKVWTSMKIIQMAKLGYTPPFDTQPHKDLFARLRQRTFILDENLYLDTAKKVKDFAIRELLERYTEFSPWGISCFAPGVRLHDTIRLRNPDTGEMQHFLVRKLQRSADLKTMNCLVQASDYLTFEVQ